MSLALLGLLTIVSVLAAIMSRRVTPLVALIALPMLAALLGGFGLQTGAFAVAGIKETAPVAAMFVFAILFFGVMTDAGLLDPIVSGVLRAVGLHPTRIVVGSALLALVAHLDGSGAVTFLVTVPAVLPLYDRLGLDRRVLACVVSLAAGVNFLPWTGPVLRASAALQIPTATLFAPLIPVQAVGLVFVFTVAWYLGRREGRRLGGLARGRGRGRCRTARAHRGGAGAAAARPLPDQPAADARRDGHDAERPARSGDRLHAGDRHRAAGQLSRRRGAAGPDRRARAGGADDGGDPPRRRRLHRDHEGHDDAPGDGALRGRRHVARGGAPHPGDRRRPGDAAQPAPRSRTRSISARCRSSPRARRPSACRRSRSGRPRSSAR